MATTYDYVDKSTGADYEGKKIQASTVGPNGSFTWHRRVSLADAATALNSGSAFGAADVIELFDVSEGMLINYIATEIVTAEGATLASTVGDATDADGFLISNNLNGAAGTWTWIGDGTAEGDYYDGTTYLGGKLYTAADTIDLTLTTAAANIAVFDIYVSGIDLSMVGAASSAGSV